MPSRSTQIKFTEADRALIAAIQRRHGLVSIADAVRHGLRMATLFDRDDVTVIVRPRRRPRPPGAVQP